MKKILIVSISAVSFFQSCKKQVSLNPSSGVVICRESKTLGISFEGYPVNAAADSLNELNSIPGSKLYAPLVGMDLNRKLVDTIRTNRVYLISLPLRSAPTTEYSLTEIRDTLSAIGMRNIGRPFFIAPLRYAIPLLRIYGTTIRNQSRLIACLGDSALGTRIGIFNFVIRSSMVSPYISVNAVDTLSGVTYGNQVLAILR